MTWWLNSSSIILVLSATGACCVSIIYGVCVNMRLSRCSRIKCLCCECIRDVETAEEMAMELEHQKKPNEVSTNI